MEFHGDADPIQRFRGARKDIICPCAGRLYIFVPDHIQGGRGAAVQAIRDAVRFSASRPVSENFTEDFLVHIVKPPLPLEIFVFHCIEGINVSVPQFCGTHPEKAGPGEGNLRIGIDLLDGIREIAFGETGGELAVHIVAFQHPVTGKSLFLANFQKIGFEPLRKGVQIYRFIFHIRKVIKNCRFFL